MPTVPPSPKVASPKVAIMSAEGQTADAPMVVDEKPAHKGSFWANPAVASMTGMATSLLLHATLIAIGIIFFSTDVQNAIKKLVVEEQNIIPTAELATDTPGGIPNPGMNDDNTREAAQAVDSSITQSDSFAETKSETLSKTLTQTGDAGASVIGIGGGKPTAGQGLGTGAAGGGSLAKFGVPGGGGGIGPKGAVFGNGGNAFRIAFICDGTGTMVGLKDTLVKRELRSTIGKLTPKQQFNIIYFRDGENAEAVDKNSLIPATPPNIKRMGDFLDGLAPQGQTNPIPAIEMAFKMKPQLLYILSDGEFDDLVPYADVIKRVAELNADKKTRVNTILFGDRDAQAEKTMQQIAKDSGGNFVFVPLDKLTQ
jgi:hypothetical protein